MKKPKASKAPKAPKEDTETKPMGQDLLMPPATTIRSLRTERAKALKTSRNATSGYGSQVADAVEKKHVDKKALGMAMSLEDLPQEKLAITLPHLLQYIEDLGLTERATQQAEMFEPPAKDKTGGNPHGRSDAESKSNGGVHRIGDAVRTVAEKAGANLNG